MTAKLPPDERKRRERERATRKSARQRERRIAAGLCFSCGRNPPQETNKRCAECWERYKIALYRYRANSPDVATLHDRNYHRRLREDVITHYGGVCVCCGVDQIEFLTMHHMNDDGASHRRHSTGFNAGNLYQVLKREGYPQGVAVMCWNCNCSQQHWGYCPHQGVPLQEKEVTQKRAYHLAYLMRLRRDVLTHYGGACICCGMTDFPFLTLHHSNGDGKQHRLEVNGENVGGTAFYRRLRAAGYPVTLNVLCWNCHEAITHRGFCPHSPTTLLN